MKIQYFPDTDTLLISLNSRPVAESSDLDEDTLLDLDADGNIVAITVEHASSRVDLEHFAFERVAAQSQQAITGKAERNT